jgi:hypothetical protein
VKGGEFALIAAELMLGTDRQKYTATKNRK